MGEEVRMSEYEANGGDDDKIGEWEIGLPTAADLTPLSQLLFPLELASAFSILPEPHRTLFDVNRALETTLSNIRVGGGQLNALWSNIFKSYNNNNYGQPIVVEAEEEEEEENTESDRDPSRKLRRIDSEEADSLLRTENSVDDPSANGAAARKMKRPRLVWTPQLHKRFVDVVAVLGIKNAVPKTIMQLMNVEGLTRENVTSHLQKYRLYLKRMQGLSSEGPSSSDHLFASTPVPQSMHVTGTGTGGGGGNGGGGGSVAVISSSGVGNGQLGMPIAVQYHGMMPIQMYGNMGTAVMIM